MNKRIMLFVLFTLFLLPKKINTSIFISAPLAVTGSLIIPVLICKICLKKNYSDLNKDERQKYNIRYLAGTIVSGAFCYFASENSFN